MLRSPLGADRRTYRAGPRPLRELSKLVVSAAYIGGLEIDTRLHLDAAKGRSASLNPVRPVARRRKRRKALTIDAARYYTEAEPAQWSAWGPRHPPW